MTTSIDIKFELEQLKSKYEVQKKYNDYRRYITRSNIYFFEGRMLYRKESYHKANDKFKISIDDLAKYLNFIKENQKSADVDKEFNSTKPFIFERARYLIST